MKTQFLVLLLSLVGLPLLAYNIIKVNNRHLSLSGYSTLQGAVNAEAIPLTTRSRWEGITYTRGMDGITKNQQSKIRK